MKQFARSVPVILFLSVASLSLIALAGCGSSGSSGPEAAKNIYAIQHSNNGETEQDSVLVFSASARGSTTPTSTLTLPNDFLGVSVAVGPTGTIYVGGADETNESDSNYGEILEYTAGSSGSATPTVTINGSNTGTFDDPQNLVVNSAGTLFVSDQDGALSAFASGFTASSTPTQYLTWGQSNFGEDGGNSIGVDTAGDIFYADPVNDVIDVFAAGATGAAAPTRQITGTTTGTATGSFSSIGYIAVDGAGDVYVTNYNYMDDSSAPAAVRTNPGTYAANKSVFGMGQRGASRLMAHPHVVAPTPEPTEIIEFAAGASGNATPTKRIGGTATNIVEPQGLVLDAVGNLYYADANGGYFSQSETLPSALLEVFSPSATGNVAPAAAPITSTSYTYPDNFPPSFLGIYVTGVAVR